MNFNNAEKRPSFEESQTDLALDLSSLDLSSQATPTLAKKPFRAEKKVSIDIMPISLDEIAWAMEDAKLQEDEDREIAEMREKVRRKKEAKAAAAAAAAASCSD